MRGFIIGLVRRLGRQGALNCHLILSFCCIVTSIRGTSRIFIQLPPMFFILFFFRILLILQLRSQGLSSSHPKRSFFAHSLLDGKTKALGTRLLILDSLRLSQGGGDVPLDLSTRTAPEGYVVQLELVKIAI